MAKKKSKSNTRRSFLIYAGLGVASVAGAVGIHRHDVQSKTLHDLSVIGNGTPTVVQVHDPSCPSCRRLKGQTTSALKASPNIQYRIADLTSAEGREMGAKFGVGKVTLLLFDKKGNHVHTVQGVTPAEQLEATFKQYL